jgi:hypothetical protein
MIYTVPCVMFLNFDAGRYITWGTREPPNWITGPSRRFTRTGGIVLCLTWEGGGGGGTQVCWGFEGGFGGGVVKIFLPGENF